MSVLYFLTRVFLFALQLVVRFRANSAVSAHDRINKEALEVAARLQRDRCNRPMSTHENYQHLALESASFQNRLCELAQRRDSAEARAHRWISRNDSLFAWRTWLARFSGRNVCFLVGVFDTFVKVLVLDHFGVGPTYLVKTAVAVITQTPNHDSI